MKRNMLILAMTSVFATLAQATEITIAYDSDPVSLDPVEQISGGTLQMAYMLFDPLVRMDSNLEPEARLAEKWEFIDPTHLRFYLRKGVKFHSGNEMSADDVIFSFDRIKKSIDFKGLFEPYEKMVKIDDYTVELVFKHPYPLVFNNFSFLFILDSKHYSGVDKKGRAKDLIEKTSGTFASTNPSGTGAFVVESRVQGQRSVYKAFNNYWDKANRGNVDTINLVTIKENATRLAALLAGDVDWIYPVPPTDIERVQKSDKHQLFSLAGDRMISIQINQNAVPEFKDVRVRQAVVQAINNAGIVDKIMRGNATAGSQYSPVGYAGHNPELALRYNLKNAQQLMKEAGLEKGFSVDFITPNDRYVNDEKIAQTVAAMLAKINIKVNVIAMPKTQYWTEYDKCAAGLQLIGWASDTGDSANYSEFLSVTRDEKTGMGQYNCTGYSNPELDALIKQANIESDEKKRSEILQKVSRIEYDDAVFIPLHWENLSWGMTNKFENFKDIINMNNFPYWEGLKVNE